jgi:hypothetical protein
MQEIPESVKAPVVAINQEPRLKPKWRKLLKNFRAISGQAL